MFLTILYISFFTDVTASLNLYNVFVSSSAKEDILRIDVITPITSMVEAVNAKTVNL
jgi:hypothetical protein